MCSLCQKEVSHYDFVPSILQKSPDIFTLAKIFEEAVSTGTQIKNFHRENELIENGLVQQTKVESHEDSSTVILQHQAIGDGEEKNPDIIKEDVASTQAIEPTIGEEHQLVKVETQMDDGTIPQQTIKSPEILMQHTEEQQLPKNQIIEAPHETLQQHLDDFKDTEKTKTSNPNTENNSDQNRPTDIEAERTDIRKDDKDGPEIISSAISSKDEDYTRFKYLISLEQERYEEILRSSLLKQEELLRKEFTDEFNKKISEIEVDAHQQVNAYQRKLVRELETKYQEKMELQESNWRHQLLQTTTHHHQLRSQEIHQLAVKLTPHSELMQELLTEFQHSQELHLLREEISRVQKRVAACESTNEPVPAFPQLFAGVLEKSKSFPELHAQVKYWCESNTENANPHLSPRDLHHDFLRTLVSIENSTRPRKSSNSKGETERDEVDPFTLSQFSRATQGHLYRIKKFLERNQLSAAYTELSTALQVERNNQLFAHTFLPTQKKLQENLNLQTAVDYLDVHITYLIQSLPSVSLKI